MQNSTHLNNHKLINLAFKFAYENKLDESLQLLIKANEKCENYITLFNIGCLFYKKREIKKAVITLEKSKALNNKFIATSIVAGLCYSHLKNFKAAESNFISVLLIDPANQIALTALSILYYNYGYIYNSIQLLNKIEDTKFQSQKIKDIQLTIQQLIKSNSDLNIIKQSKHNKISNFNDFIRKIPVSIFTDKYGTLAEKINRLTFQNKTSNNTLSISLCHFFSGNIDSAMHYLNEAKRQK